MTTGKVKIKGKEYKTVALRMTEFREKFPLESGWAVMTNIERCGEDVIVRATISSPEGNVVATGHAHERWDDNMINRTSAVENCETSAIGRALAAAGFGGSEFASANEVEHAIKSKPPGAPPKKPSQKNLEKGWRERTLLRLTPPDGKGQTAADVENVIDDIGAKHDVAPSTDCFHECLNLARAAAEGFPSDRERLLEKIDRWAALRPAKKELEGAF